MGNKGLKPLVKPLVISIISCFSFHNRNFFFGQIIEFIYQSIDLPIGSINLALDHILIGLGFCGSFKLLKSLYRFYQFHHKVMLSFILGIRGINCSDR